MPGDLRPQRIHVDGPLRRGSGVRLTSRWGGVADAPVLAGAGGALVPICGQVAVTRLTGGWRQMGSASHLLTIVGNPELPLREQEEAA